MYKKGDFVATDSGDYVMIIKDQDSFNCAYIFAICSSDYVSFGGK